MRYTFFVIMLLIVTACGGGGGGSTVGAGDDTDTINESSTTSVRSYPVVDTAQGECYDSATGISEACSDYGYDADHSGNQPSYTLSGGVVTDNVTGLMWTQSSDLDGDNLTTDADDKRSFDDAVSYCSNLSFGGYSDWRLPDIKTLYSLILFTGEDPSGYTGTDTSGLNTFLDSSFTEAFGDQSAGERIIDGQYASSTEYVDTTMSGDDTVFGVNFVDGRIKGYPKTIGASDKKFYVLCVRGNTGYGINSFTDNGDNTVTDSATGLMWQKGDSQSTNFDDAVSSCEAASTAGHTDWRLPNVKELHSIVDYSRSPGTTGSPALNAVFDAASFSNEEGEIDWGYYWSSTTHANSNGNGGAGAYVSFGRALGYMSSSILDVHGAGAQRSNNKTSESSSGASSATAADSSTFYYFGPQGDILRIDNMYRCVRDSE